MVEKQRTLGHFPYVDNAIFQPSKIKLVEFDSPVLYTSKFSSNMKQKWALLFPRKNQKFHQSRSRAYEKMEESSLDLM